MGIRYTSGRRAVVSALLEADGPKSAGEIHADVDGRVPLSSIYRSLAVLEEAGVLVPHLGVKGLVRHELAEWITGHHHHLICIDCGAVEDIEIPTGYEQEVEGLVSEIGALSSFVPLTHALEIEGRCARCA